MWKRRAEVFALAALLALAGWEAPRPTIAVSAPSVDLAALAPERVDTLADVGRVALIVAVRLLD